MKVFLWLLPFLVVIIVQTVALSSGYVLGALPTVAIFIIANLIAQALRKKWDERKN